MTALSYGTDLSDAEWTILAPLLAPTPRRGRPRQHDLRLVLNAILYILRGSEPWRLLPHEFPPWQSVYHHFRRWRLRGTWQRINDVLRSRARMLAGRTPEPHAAIIDSQTARTSEAGGERHLVVDTQGLILHVLVHPADVHDRRAAEKVLAGLEAAIPRWSTCLPTWATKGWPPGWNKNSDGRC